MESVLKRFKSCLLMFLISITGCVSNHAIHKKGLPCEYLNEKSCVDRYITIERGNINDKSYEYSLSFVELDEQGHYQSREQISDVVEFVSQQGDNQDIVLFIHGWHHNASNFDSNVIDFRNVLSTLSRRHASRTITGIYVGWRGESISIPWVNSLTFWDRKNVSIDVGQGGTIELLEKLENISDNSDYTRLVAIGHSFGGSVLFSSVKNKLYSELIELQNEREDKETDTSKEYQLSNLYILLNPAIENIQFAPLHDLSEEIVRNDKSAFSLDSPPRLVVLTSENDYATGVSFPLGRLFGTLFENQNSINRKDRFNNAVEYSQFDMDIKTLGHYEPFVTHELESTTEGKLDDFCKVIPKSNFLPLELESKSDKEVKYSGENEGWEHIFGSSYTKIKHKNRSPAYSPIWIVKVDSKIINGHNGIFEPQLNCFLEELALFNVKPLSAGK
ncbi:hypothetical protein BS057_RS23225 [Vibrio parahaemolyticus]|nr:hypothetical protein [Vibrio parahaemolyticus]